MYIYIYTHIAGYTHVSFLAQYDIDSQMGSEGLRSLVIQNMYTSFVYIYIYIYIIYMHAHAVYIYIYILHMDGGFKILAS